MGLNISSLASGTVLCYRTTAPANDPPDDGDVPDTPQTTTPTAGARLYKAPSTTATPAASANRAALVKNMVFTNNQSATTVKLNLLFLKSGGARRWLTPPDLILAPKQSFVVNDDFTLESGDSLLAYLLGSIGDAGKVDYVINGLEQDVIP